MIAALILIFLALMIFIGFMIIRFVPDDCRLIVERDGRRIIMKPGIDFLIPFIDHSIGIIQIAYRNILLCEFVFDDESFRITGSYGIIDEELIEPDTPELFSQIPEILGEELRTILKKDCSVCWRNTADQLKEQVNARLREMNIRIESVEIRSAEADETGE